MLNVRRVSRASLVLVSLLCGAASTAIAVPGCNASEPASDTGSAEFIATTAQELTTASVTRVLVTVSAPGQTAIVAELVRVNGQWQGIIGKIPVGTWTFQAVAFDASGAVVYAGSLEKTIERNKTAILALMLQQAQAPTAFANEAPRIDSMTASTNAVAPGDSVTLSARAHDANPTDTFDVRWEATAGTFDDATSLTPRWTSPLTDGIAQITLKITDRPGGAIAALTFSVNVATSNGRGAASVTTTLNTWPEVTGANASPTRIDVGEKTTLSVTASDPDGDALRYAWIAASDCKGTFNDPTLQAPQFTLAAPLPPSGKCSFTATVTDGRQGANTGTITIATGPAPLVGLAPVIDGTFQSASGAAGSQNVVFRVVAHDPEGTQVGILWSASSGALQAPIASPGRSEVTWTAPSCFAAGAAPKITATVTDGAGLVTEQTFDVAPAPGSNCAVDVAAAALWSVAAPGPAMVMWSDGKLLASDPNGFTGVLLSTAGLSTSYTTRGGRPVVWIPSNGSADLAVSHYGSFDAQRQDGTIAWTNGAFGCCGTTPFGWPIDPVSGHLWVRNRIWEMNLSDGSDSTSQGSSCNGEIHVTQTYLYCVESGAVSRWNRPTNAFTWRTSVGNGASPLELASIAADGSIVVSSSAGGFVSRVLPDGSKAWDLSLVAPSTTVITAAGRVIVGSGGGATPAAISAVNLSDGTIAWTTPVDGVVSDFLVGDNGVAYAAIRSSSKVLGLDQSTGALRVTYTNVPTPTELVLRGGVIYSNGGGKVTAFATTAGGYDKASPWPVRYHDNQRTRSATSSLNY